MMKTAITGGFMKAQEWKNRGLHEKAIYSNETSIRVY